MEMGQDKKEKIMGTGQSKKIPKASPQGCIIARWKDIAGHGGTENKRDLLDSARIGGHYINWTRE